MKKDRFNFKAQLHRACAKDDLHPVMCYIHFKDGYAYATDSKVLVRSRLWEHCSVIDAANLNGHALHRDSFAQIIKYSNAQATEGGVKCWDSGGKEAFFPYADLTGLKIPDFEFVLADIKPTEASVRCLNPALIDVASKCLVRAKGEGLVFIHQDLGRGVVIVPESCVEASQMCIVMSRMIDAEKYLEIVK